MNQYTHFYLYAKCWYARSNNLEDDLKTIAADYSAIKKEHVNINDIKLILSYAVYPLLKTEYAFIEFMSKVELRGILSACLAEMSVAKISDLGKPNFNILPPSSDATEENVKRFNWSD
jgi:hypothetical protein